MSRGRPCGAGGRKGRSRSGTASGIRGDEDRDGYVAKRPPKLSERPNIVPVYPFKDDHIGLVEVKSILEESGLGLPDYYRWRSRSGCDFCFYQPIGEWQRTMTATRGFPLGKSPARS